MKDLKSKLEQHSDHLLSWYLELKIKYTFLDPIISDSRVIKNINESGKSYGFEIIRKTLFFDCIQDIANMVLDKDKRTPSLINIFDGLEKSGIRKEFEDKYSIRRNYAEDKKTAQVLNEIEKKEEKQRRDEFNDEYLRVKQGWENLKNSSTIKAFKTIRDKLKSHLELTLIDNKYQTSNLTDLGIKWGDVSDIIGKIEPIIMGLNLIISAGHFCIEDIDKFLEERKKEFCTC